MLKQRLVTAAVMISVLLGAIFLLPWLLFDTFMALILLMGAWEWTRLAGLQSRAARYGYVLFIFALLYLVLHLPAAVRQLVILPALPWWILASILVCRYPDGASWWNNRSMLLVFGVFLLIPGWAAVVHLSLQDHYRIWIVICLTMIAFADSGAYFTGRKLGKTPLAPRVSPNKTWEGVFGGMLACALLAMAVQAFVALPDSPNPAVIALAAIAIAASSVVGDLFESMMKRQRDIKDSGDLLPGHGGVLDRLDSITAALPVFVLMLIWMDLL
jgi:phosphatidate cytidylyltransferase